MRLTIRQHWIDWLGWIADRPRGSAAAATLLLLAIAATIEPPNIDGALVDQLAGANEQLEIAKRISAATGDVATVAVILRPRNVSIAAVFANLRDIVASIQASDVRSILDAEAQLFAFGLSTDDAISELLVALAKTPQSATLIGSANDRFLLVITLPRAAEADVVETLRARDWSYAYEDATVLASSQLEADVAASLGKDLRRLIPIIVAVTLAAVFLAFGYWRALLLPLFASVAATVATFALFSVAVVSINLVTLIALPVVLIVGLANSCHFLAKSDADVGSQRDVDRTVRKTLQRVGPPFFFSTLTTAIALASLGFNELQPIAHLGTLSAGALVIVFVLVLLAAPLSLRWYLAGTGQSWQSSRPYAWLSRWLSAWRMHVTALLLLGMLAGAVAAPLLSVHSEPRAFVPDQAPFAVALRRFERHFYVFAPLQVLVQASNEDRLAGLRQAGAVRDALANHAGVRRVELQPAVNDDSAYVLHALLVSERDLTSVRRLLDGFVDSNAVDLEYSSAPLVYDDIDRQAIESLLQSLAWSVALIFAAVLLVFRSVRVLLSTLVANAVPLMIVCGTVWLIGEPLNLVTVFVFLVALGIIVDDSIHILYCRAGGERIAGSSIEFSVMLSTFMLCLGLLLCQLSDFPTTRQFAAYCALALIGAVVSNLTVLPTLLGRASDVEVFDR